MAVKQIDSLLIDDVTRERDDPNHIFCVPPDYMFGCVLRVNGYSSHEIYDLMWEHNLFPLESLRWNKKERVYKLTVKYPSLVEFREVLARVGVNPDNYVYFSQSYRFLDTPETHDDWLRLRDIFSDLYTYRKEHGYYDVERTTEPLWIPEPLPNQDEIHERRNEIAQEAMGEVWTSRSAMWRDAVSDDERRAMIEEEQKKYNVRLS